MGCFTPPPMTASGSTPSSPCRRTVIPTLCADADCRRPRPHPHRRRSTSAATATFSPTPTATSTSTRRQRPQRPDPPAHPQAVAASAVHGDPAPAPQAPIASATPPAGSISSGEVTVAAAATPERHGRYRNPGAGSTMRANDPPPRRTRAALRTPDAYACLRWCASSDRWTSPRAGHCWAWVSGFCGAR